MTSASPGVLHTLRTLMTADFYLPLRTPDSHILLLTHQLHWDVNKHPGHQSKWSASQTLDSPPEPAPLAAFLISRRIIPSHPFAPPSHFGVIGTLLSLCATHSKFRWLSFQNKPRTPPSPHTSCLCTGPSHEATSPGLLQEHPGVSRPLPCPPSICCQRSGQHTDLVTQLKTRRWLLVSPCKSQVHTT